MRNFGSRNFTPSESDAGVLTVPDLSYRRGCRCSRVRYSGWMMGRPGPQEAAPYYFRYIDLAHGENPVDLMAAQLEASLALFSGISEQKSVYRYTPEKWSIRQVLNHITDTERAFVFRALWFARGFSSPLPSYDPDTAASGAEADRVPWSAHVEEFRAVRSSSIALFRSLPPDAWDRSGTASENRFTVRALAYIIPGHVAHHVKILHDRYLLP